MLPHKSTALNTNLHKSVFININNIVSNPYQFKSPRCSGLTHAGVFETESVKVYDKQGCESRPHHFLGGVDIRSDRFSPDGWHGELELKDHSTAPVTFTRQIATCHMPFAMLRPANREYI